MRAAFEAQNRRDPEDRRNSAIISMDVKALYPSMEWGEVVTSVEETIRNSDRDIENVNYEEVGRYLAVTMTKDRIKDEGL